MTAVLAPGVQIVLAGIFGTLVLATASVRVVRFRLAPSLATDLALRIRTWWIMCAVFVSALLIGRNASLVFLAVASFLALREYLSIVPLRPTDRTAVGVAYVAILAQYGLIEFGRHDLVPIVVPIFALFALPIALLRGGETEAFLERLATISWGVLAFVYGFGYLAVLLATGDLFDAGAGGAGWMLYLVVSAQASDVVQYAAGKAVGRRPIAPRISPKKTWEGLIAGLVAATALAWLLGPWLTPLVGWRAALGGLVIGLAGFLGGLTMSAIKRDLGLKDSGTLLPGHGGMLDRIDSLYLSAPALYLLLCVLA